MFLILGAALLFLCLIIVYLVSYNPTFVKAETVEEENQTALKPTSVSKKILPPNCIWRSELLGTYRKTKNNAI